MDVFEDIRTQLVIRARLHDDKASIALKGHLLSEYLLNRIISEKIAGAKKSIRSTYSNKLKLLEKLGLCEEEVLNNLRLLNKFRNKMAHELDVSISDNEMIFHKPNHEVMIVRPKKGRYPQRHYLRLLSHGVLTQLVNHMLLNLGVDPKWDNSLV
jgi:hypothetical protein